MAQVSTPHGYSGTYPGVASLVPTLFSAQILKAYHGASIYENAGMIGGGNSPIHRVRQFENGRNKGNIVRIPLVKALGNPPTTGDTALRNNEEQLIMSSTSITLDQYRNAVSSAGKMSEQALFVKIIDEFAPSLGDWYGHMKDCLFIDSVALLPSSFSETGTMSARKNAVVYGNGPTGSWDTLVAGATLSLAVLKRVSAVAKVRGIPPLRVPGYPGLVRGVLISTPNQIADLKDDDEFKEAMKHAQSRGNDNPIFTGMVDIYDGIIIREDCHDPTQLGSAINNSASYGTVSGSTVSASALINSSLLYQDTTPVGFEKGEALFLGANACGFANAVNPHMEIAKDDDYGNQFPLAVAGIMGFAKTTINMTTTDTTTIANQRDFGVVYVCTAQSTL